MGWRKIIAKQAFILVVIILASLQGCRGKIEQPEGGTLPGTLRESTAVKPRTGLQQGGAATGTPAAPSIDYGKVKPNEAGSIMVVMFHNFVERYEKGDQLYTTTFDAFDKLLNRLYTADYRLISLTDYMNGSINTAAGRIPVVFTFDDGTAGQFNLIEENGTLKANHRSAVGILEEFNSRHPDFGLEGTFFINLGVKTFSGSGTLTQRLEYLKNRGFELGNHTYEHTNLKKVVSAAQIQEAIGKNQKKIAELLPGYTFTTLSLPYGSPSKKLVQYVISGQYQGIGYKNSGILEVGWDPAPSPFNTKFNPLAIHRVRAPGIKPVQTDLTWWLDSLKRDRQYVSDGDASIVSIPKVHAADVDRKRLGGRRLVIY